MISLINYGMGNMHSVAKALEYAGGTVHVTRDPDALATASRIVVPGVGAFRDCIGALNKTGMSQAIIERVAQGIPYLGICMGMQTLMSRSSELGEYEGLNLIPGMVKRFPTSHPEQGFKIPHMGWNDVVFPSEAEPHPVLAPLAGQQVYYVHSYYCVPEDETHLLAACSHGHYPFAAAIGRDNIIATQFHPEKSQRAGLALLKAFLQWNP